MSAPLHPIPSSPLSTTRPSPTTAQVIALGIDGLRNVLEEARAAAAGTVAAPLPAASTAGAASAGGPPVDWDGMAGPCSPIAAPSPPPPRPASGGAAALPPGTLPLPVAHRGEALELLQQMADACASATHLCDSTLSLERIDAGALELELRPTALRECVRSVFSGMAPVAAAGGVRYELRMPDDLELDGFVGGGGEAGACALALTDVGKLTQVLRNLLSNAVREGWRVGLGWEGMGVIGVLYLSLLVIPPTPTPRRVIPLRSSSQSAAGRWW